MGGAKDDGVAGVRGVVTPPNAILDGVAPPPGVGDPNDPETGDVNKRDMVMPCRDGGGAVIAIGSSTSSLQDSSTWLLV